MSLYKQGKALVLLPEQILRRLSNFVCIILSITSSETETAAYVTTLTLPLEGDITPHSSAEHAADVSKK